VNNLLLRNIFGLVYGIVYGAAHIVPGLSGGTFLVIFGCYDTVCEAFALNFKEIKKHFFFLLFFGIGTVAGIFGFAYVITFLLHSFGIQINLFFMGLILGGIPLIVQIATEETKFKPFCILPFLLGLALVVSLFFIEKVGVTANSVNLNFTLWITLYSFIAAIAMVLPGISGAFVLVAFGVYDLFMESLKTLDLAVLIPAVIGILFGIVLGAKLILLVIKKFKIIIYSAIIGMVIGSVLPLFPDGFGLNIATLTGIVCFALGGLTAVMMGKRENTT